MSSFLETLRNAIQVPGTERAPLLVHSDAFRARAVVRGLVRAERATSASTATPNAFEDLCARHVEALERIAGPRPIAFPTFNYDFPRTRFYAPASDVSQVGMLSEYARTRWATARRGGPMFPFACRPPESDDPFAAPQTGAIDPFGEDSIFGEIRRRGGHVILYGAPFISFTSVHHVERLCPARAHGGPVYRYDKVFDGVVRHEDGRESAVSVRYHCRPAGRTLGYDWDRLRVDAEREGFLRAFREEDTEVLVLDLARVCDYWLARVAEDPLYLLDAPTQGWMKPELDRLGRAFERSDFEETT